MNCKTMGYQFKHRTPPRYNTINEYNVIENLEQEFSLLCLQSMSEPDLNAMLSS
jgi:hypothetical protein